jgi:hypothetical protein
MLIYQNITEKIHSPPSSAKVEKEQELYLLSPKCASMERNGTVVPFYGENTAIARNANQRFE